MREVRIYTTQPLIAHGEWALEEGPSRHLHGVLRLPPGSPILLFDGSGREWRASIRRHDKQRTWVTVESPHIEEPSPALPTHLLVGISKGERMDYLLQKAVELGVTRITALSMQRTVVRLTGTRLVSRLQHWRSIIISACEQSGRCRIPELHYEDEPGSAFDCCQESLRLALHHRADRSWRELGDSPPVSCALLTGPEGGLTETELQMAQRRDFQVLRLGPRIMRAETAPLAVLAAIQSRWGDWN